MDTNNSISNHPQTHFQMQNNNNRGKKRSYSYFESVEDQQVPHTPIVPRSFTNRKSADMMFFVVPSLQQDTSLAASQLRVMALKEKSYTVPPGHLEEMVAPGRGALSESQLSRYYIWRRQMVNWSYRMAEACKFSKESVEISTSILDRYVAMVAMTNGGSSSDEASIMLDSTTYQLSCMASLYTSCKIHEPICISSKQMERLCGCRHDHQSIQNAEYTILQGTEWKVNPPTATGFATRLMHAISQRLEQDFGIMTSRLHVVEEIIATIELQIQLATANESFVPIRASSIAISAILNAIKWSYPHLSSTCLLTLEGLLVETLGYRSGGDDDDDDDDDGCFCHQKIDKIQLSLLTLVVVSQGYGVCHSLGGDNDESKKAKPAVDIDSFRAYSPRSVVETRKHLK